MTPEEVKRLYNRDYAEAYDGRFLHSDNGKPDADFEIGILRDLLSNGGPWLDVACGTGYFLSQFPNVERTGLDLSPAMIELASTRNPGVEIREQSFVETLPEWRDKWAVVSCMWYAYGLVQTMGEVEKLIQNLSEWTSPDGVCFVPICDPVLVSGQKLPYAMKGGPWEGDLYITGITWSYYEDDGSKHRHVFAPHVTWMVGQFEMYFEDVSLITYPSTRPGLLARKKRDVPLADDEM